MKILQATRPRPIIPIISLIDILTILLIFFIVTTTFKEKKALLNIDLPSTKSLPTTSTTERRMTIAVSEIGEIFLADRLVDEAILAEELMALRAAQPSVKLELKADTHTPLGVLVTVWDSLKEAGIEIKDVPARIELHAEGAGG